MEGKTLSMMNLHQDQSSWQEFFYNWETIGFLDYQYRMFATKFLSIARSLNHNVYIFYSSHVSLTIMTK